MSPVIPVLTYTFLGLLQLATSNQPPRMINFQSTLFISEDVPAGTKLGELEAMDIDDDRLDFSIRGEIANLILGLTRTGEKKMDIKLKQKLDREIVDQYSILFEVEDGLNTVQKYATLYVNDVNDNAPQFLGQPYRAEVDENSPVGASVFQVSAQDPDSGIWGLVSYNLTTRMGLFAINSLTGEVTLREQLDYETEKFLQLEIMASDGDGLNSTTDLIINVKDIQDTAPYFLKLPYIATVNEDAVQGTSVLQVTAIDGDRGDPHPVKYSFVGDIPEYFDIDEATGVISVAKSLDREDAAIRALIGSIEMTVQTEEVTDKPQGPTTAQAAVTITILDVNDEGPTFNKDRYIAQVPENTQARIPVTILPYGTEIIVTDYDQGENGRFELSLEKNGVPYDAFEVVPKLVLNEASVLLRVNDASLLDFENTQTINFQIVAKETTSTSPHTSSATIELSIIDMNDNWPEFDELAYYANIPENSAKDTYVTKVTANDQDTGTFGNITYSIRGSSSNLFSIDASTGEVYVAVDADRDHTLMDREKLDTLFVIVEAEDRGGLRSSVQLQVRLTDINDNTPIPTRGQYEGFIKENQLELERPVTVQATDLDLPPNNELEYSIISGDPDGIFTIDNVTGDLAVVKTIDFEAIDAAQGGVYNLGVMISDKGTPPLNTSISVLITVEDLNDVAPIFKEQSYTAIISEKSPAGMTVSTVSAEDSDGTSPNKDIIYRIEGGARDKFRMDSQKGIISVERGADLDRDRYGDQYQLTVVAIDRGTPPLTGTTMVNINITDVNNKFPVFTPDSYVIKLAENAALGQLVYTYTATDLDENAKLTYSLLGDLITGEDEDKRPVLDTEYLNGLFEVHKGNGTVYVNGALDREVVEEVTLTLFVEDENADQPPIQNAKAKLTIVLEDVNDNPPRFIPEATYRARISEASKPGIEVKQVLATDRDKSSGVLNYSMVYDTPESTAFEITDANRQTGVITLKTEVDHEQTQLINLTVMADDRGMPPLNSLALVYVEIEDVNDNSPEWVLLESTVFVQENAPVGTNVTRVMAVDMDSGHYGEVTYHMTGGDSGKFGITIETGEIEVTDLLDREVESEYRLTIEARDNSGAVLSQQRKTPGYITIKVLDINDFTPKFDKDRYVVNNLQENVNIGGQVLLVRAGDMDEGQNGAVRYSIDPASGNASGIFDVDPTSGQVYVNKSLQGYVGWRHVVIFGQDQGKPPLKNKTNVYVYVEDVNDHKPKIIQPQANSTIFFSENSPVGHLVTQVMASDNDEGVNGEVRYELVENPTNSLKDWLKFTIEPATGIIKTATVIDRETQETFYLEVRAYDLGKPSYDDRRIIKIVARDIDDNPPGFNRAKYPPPYMISVVEEEENSMVAQLNIADDPDSGNNSVICYYLVGGQSPWREQFRLDKMTGALYLDQKLDREAVPMVDLVIKASENCWSGQVDKQPSGNVAFNVSDPTLLWVQVKVIDINDNLPVFTRKWFTAGVSRDTDDKEPVLFFKNYVYDPDEEGHAQFTFSIKPPIRITEPLKTQLRQRKQKDPFILDPNDGVLRTNTYFSGVMRGYFEFMVQVQDFSAGYKDVANVSIYLLNEEQRSKAIFRGTTADVGSFKDAFAAYLSNITGTIINVDKIRTHQDASGKSDQWRVDMFIHAINPKTGEVLDSDVLIGLVDKNYQSLVHLFDQYNMIEIVPAVEPAASSSLERVLEQDLMIILLIVAAALAILLIILIATFIACRKKYKRKLKAATAMAFEISEPLDLATSLDKAVPGSEGSRDSGLNRLEMPGTNLHTYEGSNPIWLEQCDNGWTKDADSASKRSGPSVDESAVEPRDSFDEQEMSIEMFNDEFDHFNKVPGTKYVESDLYLQAALEERKAAQQRQNNELNHNKPNGRGPPRNGLSSPKNGHHLPNGMGGGGGEQGYDNITFISDSQHTRSMEGLQTTDI